MHALGRRSRDAIERARREVATLMNALPEEVIFTSGGTEGDNLAVRGLARAAWAKKKQTLTGKPHVISSALEHPAVGGALDELRAAGFDVTLLPANAAGEISVDDLRAALRDETVLVTLALANHEIGNVYPVKALAAVARERGALFHTDAVQAAGRIPVDVQDLGVDAATISAHKLYGPKGVGAVYLRRGIAMDSLVAGGHQERERRGGTENVPGIVGFGVACALATRVLTESTPRIERLRDRLEAKLLQIPDARLHGAKTGRVPNTTNVGYTSADGQLVLIALDLEGVCVSTGAACTSGSLSPSAVLLAMGLAPERAKEAIRFSLGHATTEAEVDRAAALTAQIVSHVRGVL